MSLPIDVTASAARDVDSLTDYFMGIRPDLADRFLAALQEGYKSLARTPGLGRVRDFGNPALAGMRMRRVPHFDKYLIFYRPLHARIEIIRVLDGRRDLDRLFAE